MRRQLPPDSAEPKYAVTLKLNVNFDRFDAQRQRLFRHAVAGFLGVSPDEVTIVCVEKGSVIVTLKLPGDSAERLLKAIQTNDEALASALSIAKIPLVDLATVQRIQNELDAGRRYILEKRDVEAVETLNQALSLCEEMHDTKREAAVRCNLGIAYEHLGKIDDAMTMHHQALDLDSSLENDEGIANHCFNLGRLELRYGKERDGTALLRRALAIAQRLGNVGLERSIKMHLPSSGPATR